MVCRLSLQQFVRLYGLFVVQQVNIILKFCPPPSRGFFVFHLQQKLQFIKGGFVCICICICMCMCMCNNSSPFTCILGAKHNRQIQGGCLWQPCMKRKRNTTSLISRAQQFNVCVCICICMWQQVKREWRCYFLKHEAQPSKVSPTLCMEMPTSASAEI